MATQPQAEWLADLATIARDEAKRLGFEAEKFVGENSLLDARKIEHGLTGREASALINGLTKEYLQKHWNWRPTSKQTVVAEFAYQYAKARNTNYIGRRNYDAILRFVRHELNLDLQGEFRPLIFTRNENGSRTPVDKDTAEDQFRKALSTVKAQVNRRLNKQEEKQEEQQDLKQEDEELDMNDFIEEEEEQDIEEIEIEDEEFPTAAQDLLRRIKNICAFAADRNIGDGVAMDAIGIRSFEDSAKLFNLGIEPDRIVSNIVQHWQPEAIRAIWSLPGEYISQHQRIAEPWDIDPQTFVPKVEVPGLAFVSDEDHHANLKLLLTYMHARIPTLCWGGSGTGKTTAYRHAAECLRQALGYNVDEAEKFPFGFLSMTRGTAPSAFNGRPMITNTAVMIEFMYAQAEQDSKRMKEIAEKAHRDGDVVTSIWEQLYGGGGVMLLDEIDAGDENLILLVNAAIANGHFANTATGKVVERHPDFIIGFAGNTNGMGANKLHGARNRLDHATLDRARLGRIPFNLDMKLAENIFRKIIRSGR